MAAENSFSLEPGNTGHGFVTITKVSTSTTWTISDDGTTTTVISDPQEIIKGLYSFEDHLFDNCGKSGENGPSLVDCINSYTPSWTNNTNYFNLFIRGTQIWTAPESAEYTFKVAGASGGRKHNLSVDSSGAPGLGSHIYANYSIKKGRYTCFQYVLS